MPGTEGPPPGPIVVGEGGVWIYMFPHLVHVDPAHKTIEAIIPSGFATTVAVGFHQVWLASSRQKGITRVNPSDNTALTPIELPGSKSSVTTASASDLATGLAVGEGAVWETWGSGDLMRIDPHREKAERIDLQANLFGVAAGEGSVWVGDQLDGTIIPVDPASGKAGKPIELFGNIDAIAVGEGEVWVLDKGAGTVTPIDPSEGEPKPQVGVGEKPTDMEVGLGAVWVSHESGTITRIDALTHRETSFDLDVPVAGIAVDPDNQTLWVLAAERNKPL